MVETDMAPTEAGQKKPDRSYYSIVILSIGLLLTATVVTAFYIAHWHGEVCEFQNVCVTKWDYLKASPPNEIGDTLAGFAGALAFIWLVATVLLQAHELKEQRQEFVKMANAQGHQVTLLIAQGEIFADEQKQRDEARAGKLLEVLLADLDFNFSTAGFHVSLNDGSLGSNPTILAIFPFKRYDNVEKIENHISNLYDRIGPITDQLIASLATVKFPIYKVKGKSQYIKIFVNLKSIDDLRSRLSEDAGYRIDQNHLKPFRYEIERLLALVIWEDEKAIANA